jgi:hypothetical protein
VTEGGQADPISCRAPARTCPSISCHRRQGNRHDQPRVHNNNEMRHNNMRNTKRETPRRATPAVGSSRETRPSTETTSPQPNRDEGRHGEPRSGPNEATRTRPQQRAAPLARPSGSAKGKEKQNKKQGERKNVGATYRLSSVMQGKAGTGREAGRRRQVMSQAETCGGCGCCPTSPTGNRERGCLPRIPNDLVPVLLGETIVLGRCELCCRVSANQPGGGM